MQKITIEDITKIKNAGNVVISPDGKHAVFTVNRPDVKKNGYDYNLWLYDMEKGEASQMTFLGKDRSAIWDDSETLLIPTTRTPDDIPDKLRHKSVFYRLNIKGGEAHKAFQLAERVGQTVKVGDGLYAMTILRNRNWLNPDENDSEVCEEELDYHVIDELPLWGNDRGFVSGDRTGLYLYNEKTDELKELTDPYFDVRSLAARYGYNSSVAMQQLQIWTTANQIEAAVDDAHYNEMYSQTLQISDTEEYFKGAHELEDYLIQEQVYLIPMFNSNTAALRSTSFEGYTTNGSTPYFAYIH